MKPKKNRIFCNDCQKTKMLFSSEKKAELFIERNSEEMKAFGRYVPVRVYYCNMCGGWHVTSNPNADVFSAGALYIKYNNAIEKNKTKVDRWKKKNDVINKEHNLREEMNSAYARGNYRVLRTYSLRYIRFLNEFGNYEEHNDDLVFACNNVFCVVEKYFHKAECYFKEKDFQRASSYIDMCMLDLKLIEDSLGADGSNQKIWNSLIKIEKDINEAKEEVKKHTHIKIIHRRLDSLAENIKRGYYCDALSNISNITRELIDGQDALKHIEEYRQLVFRLYNMREELFIRISNQKHAI